MNQVGNLLLLPGDGIGPEVMGEVRKVVGWLGDRQGLKFECEEDLAGGCALDAHGVPMTEDTEEVADILIDLARRETQALSVRVAQKVVDGLGKEVKLINNPHRYAGFRVLRAPDVPSVLLELGYLSNVEDEALLRSPEWRQQAAEVLARAIQSYSTVVQASAGR